MKTLLRQLCWLSVLLLSPPLLNAQQLTASPSEPVKLEFSGYRFGQSPSANMVCGSGYCKNQAPTGDGLLDRPFSVYETPGALTTLGGLTIIRPRYTFWEEQLYRLSFQVDCAPLEAEECLDDIIKTLDREYGLTALTTNDSQQFLPGNRIALREFVTEAGAFIKIRAVMLANEWQMPIVDIADREMVNRVGATLSPNYKPHKIERP
jgi:hypothetical protein